MLDSLGIDAQGRVVRWVVLGSRMWASYRVARAAALTSVVFMFMIGST